MYITRFNPEERFRIIHDGQCVGEVVSMRRRGQQSIGVEGVRLEPVGTGQENTDNATDKTDINRYY